MLFKNLDSQYFDTLFIVLREFSGMLKIQFFVEYNFSKGFNFLIKLVTIQKKLMFLLLKTIEIPNLYNLLS